MADENKCVTKTAEMSIKEAAHAKQDAKLLQDIDLKAKAVH